MKRRPAGHGTSEKLSSGRHRARIPMPDGRRHTVGVFDEETDAIGTLDAIVEEKQQGGELVLGATLRGALPRFLDETEQARSYAAMPNLRSIARVWLETAPFADWSVRQIDNHHIQRWVKRMSKGVGKDRGSIRQRLTALRKFFNWAIDERLVDDNPARLVKVPRGEVGTEDAWTYLTPDEQRRLLACKEIPEEWRLQIVIALGTGIREGEHFALRLADVHTEHDPKFVIRYGSRRRAPKGRKIREVPLNGDVLAAIKRWLELLPAHCKRNEHRLFFPGSSGGFHKVSRVPGWPEWLAAAGIARPVRWHDLRHTCGASLVSGWWGRAWRLEEVRDLLGHWSIKETERYAHLSPDVLRKAARETKMGSPIGAHGTAPARLIQESNQVVTQSIGVDNGAGNRPEQSPELTPQFGPAVGAAALELLRAADAGEDCDALRLRLGGLVAGSKLVRLATEAMGDGPRALDAAIELAGLLAGTASRTRAAGGRL